MVVDREVLDHLSTDLLTAFRDERPPPYVGACRPRVCPREASLGRTQSVGWPRLRQGLQNSPKGFTVHETEDLLSRGETDADLLTQRYRSRL